MNQPETVKEFYINDIVYKFDKQHRITIGAVVDSYEASSDVLDVSDQSLNAGQIRVLWYNSSNEKVLKQTKVHLMNRGILPGDIVRRLEKGKETQRGYCKETKQTAVVQIVGTSKVVENVAGHRLQPLRRLTLESAVSYDQKFGRIEGIDQIVKLQSKDGSMVEVQTGINNLTDYWLAKRKQELFDYFYPGQEVTCIPADFNGANWKRKTKVLSRNMQSRQRFTVQEVTDVLVEIAVYNDSSGYSELLEIVKDDISKLNILENTTTQSLELMERRFLKLSSHDVLLSKKDWIRKMSLAHRSGAFKSVNSNKSLSKVPLLRSVSQMQKHLNEQDQQIHEESEEDWWTEEEEESVESTSSDTPQIESLSISTTSPSKRHYPPKATEMTSGHTLPVEVLCVESKITVVWQDGTEEKDVPSTQLYYSISLDDHEFFPGECVVKNEVDHSGKYGVVQHVNYLDRTATVKWFSYSEIDVKPAEVETNEMSVYDLKKHSKFVFRPGSTVKAKPLQENMIGTVIDSSKEGFVMVKWLKNNIPMVSWPQQIELLPDSDDFDYSDDDSGTEEGRASWETESMQSYTGDLSDETVLQNLAARLDFVRTRIVYLQNVFQQHTITDGFAILKDLLLVYENSSYLDKLLGTSFFTFKSKHLQVLLAKAKEKATAEKIELRGRLFSTDNLTNTSKYKAAEKDNINKLIKLEHKVNGQIEKKEENKDPGVCNTPLTPDSDVIVTSLENVCCLELLTMLKFRMDLAYAEIISRVDGHQALSVLTKTMDNVVTPSTSALLPSCPTTPEISTLSLLSPLSHLTNGLQSATDNVPFSTLDDASPSHHFFNSKFESTDLQRFLKAIQKEYKLLQDSLPAGLWVRSFSNRMDLLSVMIRGPAKTPYEDGLFLFDIQFSQDYPRSPPLVHYISYSSERLNPNLYVEGKVCVSLLGTWMGKGTEVWHPDSTLLQLIISIQGLILVSEPYYNEAGYEKQTDTQQGYENSRTYNELVILKLVQSMTKLILAPPPIFKQEIRAHFVENGQKLCDRLQDYCNDTDPIKPSFPLLPVSKGLKLSLSSALSTFQNVLKNILMKNSDTKEANGENEV